MILIALARRRCHPILIPRAFYPSRSQKNPPAAAAVWHPGQDIIPPGTARRLPGRVAIAASNRRNVTLIVMVYEILLAPGSPQRQRLSGDATVQSVHH